MEEEWQMNKSYSNISELLSNICEIKSNVLKLHGQELREYRHAFFSQKIGKYRLNAVWSYIYDDIDFARLIYELKLR